MIGVDILSFMITRHLVMMTIAPVAAFAITSCASSSVSTSVDPAPSDVSTPSGVISVPSRLSTPYDMTGATTPSDIAILKLQEVALPYVAQLAGLTYGQGEGRPGLGGIIMDLPNGTISLAWKGPLPSKVNSLVSRPPSGLTVNVTRAKYTRTELKTAAEALVASDVGTQTGIQWSQIGLSPTGAGLDVQGYPVASSNATLGSAAARYSTNANGVTVNLSPGSEPVEFISRSTETNTGGLVGGRWKGSGPPWIGGEGIMRSDGTGTIYCSTGFIGTYAGADAVVTADHCGGPQWTSGDGTVMGSIAAGLQDRDSAMLEFATAGSGSGFYGGDWQGNIGYPVARLGASVNGLYTCSGGAASGTHCNVVVRNDWTYYDGPQGEVFPAVYVQQIDGQLFANAGDSGGPVFSFTGQGGLTAAVGVVIAGDLNQAIPSSCGSLAPQIAPKCTVYGWYVQSTQWGQDYPYVLKVAN